MFKRKQYNQSYKDKGSKMDYEQPGKNTNEITTSKAPEQKRSHVIIRLMCMLVILGLLTSTAWFAWQWHGAQGKIQDLTSQKTQLEQQAAGLRKDLSAKKSTSTSGTNSTASNNTVPCTNTPSDTMKENIKAALDSKNTAAFSTYTTNPVHYILAASEYGGDFTPNQAATALEYTHSATGPWDFNLLAATIASYNAGSYSEYFNANTYVGRAASGMVVAFDFNCNGKISDIFVAADESLLP